MPGKGNVGPGPAGRSTGGAGGFCDAYWTASSDAGSPKNARGGAAGGGEIVPVLLGPSEMRHHLRGGGSAA